MNTTSTTYNETKVELNPVIIYQRMSTRVLENFKNDCAEYKKLGTLKDKFNDIVDTAKYQLKIDGNWYFGKADKVQMKKLRELESKARSMLDVSIRDLEVE